MLLCGIASRLDLVDKAGFLQFPLNLLVLMMLKFTLYRRPRGPLSLGHASLCTYVASAPALLQRLSAWKPCKRGKRGKRCKRRKPQTFVYNIFLTFDAAKFKIANFPSRYLKFRGQIYDNSQISLTQNKAEKIPKKKIKRI